MNNNISVDELLKGCSLIKDENGNIIVQTIMNMQLAFLTTSDENSLDERFANPLNSVSASNSGYGNMIFNNKTDKEVIIPPQLTVQTKQKAQNHSMIKAAYLNKQSNYTYNDAGCVQGSETGHFRNTQEFRMIPLSMRENFFGSMGKNGDYSRLYTTIESFGSETKSATGKYLDKYYTKYDKKLEQFIAHFERPEKLIGVIVLIDDEIVAIDKFPSFTYGKQIWDVLIRDSYSSLAIISELKKSKSVKKFTAEYEKTTGNSVLEKIENALNKTKKNNSDLVSNNLEIIMDLDFAVKLDGDSQSNTNVKSYSIKSEGYVGQYISESNFHHMVSLVKKKAFDSKNLKIQNELRKRAKTQNRFTI